MPWDLIASACRFVYLAFESNGHTFLRHLCLRSGCKRAEPRRPDATLLTIVTLPTS